MDILVVSNMYPPHYYGGYELSCRDVLEAWRERGHRVTVLTTKMRVRGVDDPPGERQSGVRRDLEFYWDDHALVSPPLRRRIELERSNQALLREALQETSPQAVSVWNMGAMSLGLLAAVAEAGIPLVLVVCDDWLDYGPALDPWTRLFTGHPLAARLARRVTGLPTGLPENLGEVATCCFVSDSVRRHAEDHTPFRFRRQTVVYSGIDTADFPLAPTGDSDRPWRWRLLVVGRIDPRKGVETAIRALPLLPDEATIDVLGRGDPDHLRDLHELVDALGLGDRVRFDIVERAELRSRYAQADALVFPPTWAEPFGLIPVEAMACRTPVVASGRGGSAEFLADGDNCLLFTPGDPASLADALHRLAGDPDLRLRLTHGGLATASELTVQRLSEALEAWHLATIERFQHGLPLHRPHPATQAAGR